MKSIFISNVLNELADFSRTLFFTIIKHKISLSMGFAGLLVLNSVLILIESPRIESDLKERTQVNLQQRGFKRVSVELSGREVVLNGEVSSSSGLDFAQRVAMSIYGVRSVESNLKIEPFRLPHLRLTRSLEDVLRLEGELPTDQLANLVKELVTRKIRHNKLINLMLADPEVTDPKWLASLEGLLGEADLLVGLEIEVGAGKVAVGGLLHKQTDYNVLIQRISQFASVDSLNLVNKVGITPNKNIATLIVDKGPGLDSKHGQSDADASESEPTDLNSERAEILPIQN